ncbi:MAG: nucleoside-diphosphate kinase [Rickettsiales bacterium]|nr:nucleoside-diphosphate kinase [Rickettsiales bacterium]OUV83291.1 MAG: nucleoside-diphosphate kinase [Rickettsiales bacterium TMED131]
MPKQKTLSIIKPDAMQSNFSGNIITFLEEKGFNIVAQKKIKLTNSQAKLFYEVHKDRPFFSELVDFMISGPISVQILEASDAVAFYRKVMGATNPDEAEDDTIRKKYGKDIQCNAVHGSDSVENAKIEIAFFFSVLEISS